MKRYQLRIGGHSIDPQSQVWFESQNPYTAESWAEIPRGNAHDVDAAVQAAHAALTSGPWADLTATQRGALLWFRTGSNVVVPQAFRLLSIPTTA